MALSPGEVGTRLQSWGKPDGPHKAKSSEQLEEKRRKRLRESSEQPQTGYKKSKGRIANGQNFKYSQSL